jgi:hypothetical protein
LMQVLTRVHLAKFQPFGGVQAAFDPVANLRVGTAILRHYLQMHGTVPLALKAYVGAAHAEHDSGYAAKVMAARERLAAVAAGRPSTERRETPGRSGAAEGSGLVPSGRTDVPGEDASVRLDRSERSDRAERAMDAPVRVPVLLRGLDELRAPEQI